MTGVGGRGTVKGPFALLLKRETADQVHGGDTEAPSKGGDVGVREWKASRSQVGGLGLVKAGGMESPAE